MLSGTPLFMLYARKLAVMFTVVLLVAVLGGSALAQGTTPAVTTALVQTVGAATRDFLDQIKGQKRVALVIGNSRYQNVSRLPNPENDAKDMDAALKSLGFDVYRIRDVNKADMEVALADFSDEAVGADIALVFYAGHGIEVDRQNYLIPVDAKLETDRRLRFEAISLDDVMVALEEVKGVRIVLLDACRDNPFANTMRSGTTKRSVGRGLARVEAANGTVIGFAAKEGTVADDGVGRNSPFTSALLANLTRPEVELSYLFRLVRDEVMSATNGLQEPYISASLSSERVYLVPPSLEPEPAVSANRQQAPVAQPTAARMRFERAERAWGAIKDTKSKTVLEDFIARFEETIFASLAAARIEEMDEPPAIQIIQPAKPTLEQLVGVVPVSEAATEPEVSSSAEPQLTEEQVASLTPIAEEAVLAIVTDPVILARSVQSELDRLGCEPGKPDGIWGRKSSQAIDRFNRHARVRLASTSPTPDVLETLEGVQGRVCPLVCGAQFKVSGDRCVKKTCPAGQNLSAKGTCFEATPVAARSGDEGAAPAPNAQGGASAALQACEAKCAAERKRCERIMGNKAADRGTDKMKCSRVLNSGKCYACPNFRSTR